MRHRSSRAAVRPVRGAFTDAKRSAGLLRARTRHDLHRRDRRDPIRDCRSSCCGLQEARSARSAARGGPVRGPRRHRTTAISRRGRRESGSAVDSSIAYSRRHPVHRCAPRGRTRDDCAASSEDAGAQQAVRAFRVQRSAPDGLRLAGGNVASSRTAWSAPGRTVPSRRDYRRRFCRPRCRSTRQKRS